MNHSSFQRLVKKWVNNFTNGENLTFEQLVELSKTNERLRNVCAFYALSDRKKKQTLERLAYKDPQVNQMLKDLFSSLSTPGVSYYKTRSTARMLKHKFFSRQLGVLTRRDVQVTPASRDMAKFLHSLVWENEYSHKEASPDKQRYIQEKLGQMKLVRK